ncbi:MAG: DUF4870 domain-containing protein [Xanthomonadaceae bacterium]|jgi:uncharacterized Tic20 family protein|nr:DUF4870 domain-containing protein [Xanthomonadaceae bacterium]
MSSEVSQDNKTAALLAYVLSIFFGWLGALIMWLINKDKSDKEFATEHAKEVLNFQITLVFAYIAIFILSIILGFISGKLAALAGLLYLLIVLANVALCVMGALAANKGESYRFPFALRLIK